MINFIQHGVDGLGHQLHGLLSSIIMHNIKDFYFNGHAFLKKPFQFDHLNNEGKQVATNYMKEIVTLFIDKYGIKEQIITNHVHAHEIYHIPKNYNEHTLYSIDNAYYFDRIGLNNEEIELHNKNIKDMRSLFINELLPDNRLIDNSIVIHIRLGDALRCDRKSDVLNHYDKVCNLIVKLKTKYIDYTYYIHSDGDVNKLENIMKENQLKYELCNKNTDIMNVLSDFIHCKILVCGNSALSKVCSFITDKELLIIPDENRHSMPSTAIKISDF